MQIHYGIDDYTKITITAKDNTVEPGQSSIGNGNKKTICISYDGKIISEYSQYTSAESNETQIIENSMPTEILEAVDAIVEAQKNPQNSKKALSALKSVVTLDEDTMSKLNTKSENNKSDISDDTER